VPAVDKELSAASLLPFKTGAKVTDDLGALDTGSSAPFSSLISLINKQQN
jgi:hypothetical protein